MNSNTVGSDTMWGSTLKRTNRRAYEALAKRTAPSTEQNAETGLGISANIYIVLEHLKQAQTNGVAIDKLKRALFYGKGELPNGQRAIQLPDQTVDLVHAVIGIIGESGELAENIRDYLQPGAVFDPANLKEELGDLMWYIALACNAIGVALADVQQDNIDKLKRRYPDNYSNEAALARADKDAR